MQEDTETCLQQVGRDQSELFRGQPFGVGCKFLNALVLLEIPRDRV